MIYAIIGTVHVFTSAHDGLSITLDGASPHPPRKQDYERPGGHVQHSILHQIMYQSKAITSAHVSKVISGSRTQIQPVFLEMPLNQMKEE